MNRAATVVVLCLLPLVTFGQLGMSAGQREVDAVRSYFDAGRYKDVLQRTEAALSAQNFLEPQRLELNRLAGLAAFYLGELEQAEGHLTRVLQLNPDHVLDPFAVPPAAVEFFEGLRRKNAPALDLIRQQIALREEQERRAALERSGAEVQRALQRQIGNRSFLVNLVPFGAGQFQQGRSDLGWVFASSEGALAALSITSFWMLESIIRTDSHRVRDRLGTPDDGLTLPIRGVPAARAAEAETWRWMKLASGVAFYVVYLVGAADAIAHHRTPAPGTLPPPPPPRAEAQPFLFPVEGGAGAGLRSRF